ncbi:hypothetical protein AC249_AIPGENE19564 [Exaiptasia diaphana]|nr:hypothetical protein AC249_AIPGENE19564 [Exaiptasia diaphana]
MDNDEYGVLAPNVWKELFKMFELKQIMRQRESKEFAELLNRLREALWFDLDPTSVIRIIYRTLPVMWRYFQNQITWPNIAEWRNLIGNWPELPNSVGAIDVTPHEIYCPLSEPQRPFYSGHRHYHCLNTQLVMDNEGHIRFLHAGFLGSTHDSTSYKLMQPIGPGLPLDLPAGVNLLADQGYPDGGALMTPLSRKEHELEVNYIHTACARILTEKNRIRSVYICDIRIRSIANLKTRCISETSQNYPKDAPHLFIQNAAYFNFNIQTSSETVHPDKRSEILNFQQQQQTPVSFKDGQLTANKRNASQMDFSVRKKNKLQATVLDFDYDASFDSKLTHLSSVASLSPFSLLDVKVKLVSKTEEKQKIIVRDHPCFKTDCMIFDGTESIRLELWESAIDKMARGKFRTLKLRSSMILSILAQMSTQQYKKSKVTTSQI